MDEPPEAPKAEPGPAPQPDAEGAGKLPPLPSLSSLPRQRGAGSGATASNWLRPPLLAAALSAAVLIGGGTYWLTRDGGSGSGAIAARGIAPSQPKDAAAAAAFARGLDARDRGELVVAATELRTALERAPGFVPAEAALAATLAEQQTAAAARTVPAAPSSATLDAPTRLWVAAWQAERDERWGDAAAQYRALLALDDGSDRDGARSARLGLLRAQVGEERFDDALATLATLRATTDDPVLDFQAARIARDRDDPKAMTAMGDRAIERADDAGRPYLAARARAETAAALRDDEPARAAAYLADAERGFTTAGDRAAAGRVLRTRGQISVELGAREPDLGRARTHFEEGVIALRASGEPAELAGALVGVATVDVERGALPEAQAALDEALALPLPADAPVRGEVQLGLARVAVEGAIPGAAATVAAIATELEAGGQLELAIAARDLETRARLDVGDAAGARTAAATAERLAGKTTGGPARRDALVAKARTELARDPAAAIRTLESAADKLGQPLTLEGRLLLGAAQLKVGKRAEGTATLQAVERDAKATGAEAAARRAARLLSSRRTP